MHPFATATNAAPLDDYDVDYENPTPPPHPPCMGFDWLASREASRCLSIRETRASLNADLLTRGITPTRPKPNTMADWSASRGVEKFGADVLPRTLPTDKLNVLPRTLPVATRDAAEDAAEDAIEDTAGRGE
jgi:hypothetical protein